MRIPGLTAGEQYSFTMIAQNELTLQVSFLNLDLWIFVGNLTVLVFLSPLISPLTNFEIQSTEGSSPTQQSVQTFNTEPNLPYPRARDQLK